MSSYASLKNRSQDPNPKSSKFQLINYGNKFEFSDSDALAAKCSIIESRHVFDATFDTTQVKAIQEQ